MSRDAIESTLVTREAVALFSMIPTPAASCFRVRGFPALPPLPFPFCWIGIEMCSASLDEK